MEKPKCIEQDAKPGVNTSHTGTTGDGNVDLGEVIGTTTGKNAKGKSQSTKEVKTSFVTGTPNATVEAGAQIACLEAATVNVEDQDHISTSSIDDGLHKNATGVDWTMVVRSPTRQNASPNLRRQHQKLSAQQNVTQTITSSNGFEVLAHEEDAGINSSYLEHDKMKKQLVPCTSSGKEERCSELLKKQIDVRQTVITNNLAQVLVGHQAHSSSTPRLHISSPAVAKIIKDTQVAMMLNSNHMINKPLVTLNTSVHEIPSKFLESFGDHGSETGQVLLSTRNDKEVVKIPPSRKEGSDELAQYENDFERVGDIVV